jgi:hypothetical protein
MANDRGDGKDPPLRRHRFGSKSAEAEQQQPADDGAQQSPDTELDEPGRKFTPRLAALQDSKPQLWSTILNEAWRTVLVITAAFAALGFGLEIFEYMVQSIGAQIYDTGPPDWSRIDLTTAAENWAIAGAIISIVTIAITRPRNAVIATVIAASGILAVALSGAMLFATVPDHFGINVRMGPQTVLSADIEMTRRSVAENVPAGMRFGPLQIAFADQTPLIAALAAASYIFSRLVAWIPIVLANDNKHREDPLRR